MPLTHPKHPGVASGFGRGMVDIQGHKFPGYGRCIYCGVTGALKDEHIVPFSLGGKAIIEAASCGACEKITSYLDGYLARQIFHEYRVHVGMKSRRPKERPTELAAMIVKQDGTHERRQFVPKEHPYFLVMPVWNLPGILLGEEPTHNFAIILVDTRGHAEDRRDGAGAGPGHGYGQLYGLRARHCAYRLLPGRRSPRAVWV